MKAQHLGLAVGVSAVCLLSSCSDDDSNKKVLTGPQVGDLTVQLDGGNAITFTQPTQIKMSGTALYDDAGDTVTISLTLTNGSKSVLHNTKALFTNVSEGTVTGDGGILVSASAEGGGVPYVYFGPESIASGGTATAEVVVTGVTGAGTELTMDVDIMVHPWIFVPGGDDLVASDSSGSGESLLLDSIADETGWGGGLDGATAPDTWTRGDAVSPDGRYVYFTGRNQPAILTFDTVEHTLEIGPSLMGGTIAHDGTGDVGFIDGLTESRDGQYLFAVLNHGAHVASFSNTWPAPTEIEVLKLSSSNLGVVDRVTIWEETAPPIEGGTQVIRGRRMGLSTDGSLGAVAIMNDAQVFLIDTDSMTVVDADDATEGDQGFATTTLAPRHAVPSSDGSTIYVAINNEEANDGTLEVIDTATGTSSNLAPTTVSAGGNQPTFLEFGPDGRLYYGRSYDGTTPGLSIYDPVGDAWTEIDGDMNAITFLGTTYLVWDNDAGEIRWFDSADDSELPFIGTGTTGLPNPDVNLGHGIVLTLVD